MQFRLQFEQPFDVYEKISRQLQNSYIKADHLRHVVAMYGGEHRGLNVRDLKLELERLARESDKPHKILRAVRYLSENYTLRAASFYSFFHPFAVKQAANLFKLNERYTNMVFTPTYDADGQVAVPGGMVIARVHHGFGSGFRILYARLFKSAKVEPETKIPVPQVRLTKHPVYVRAEGVEIRADLKDAPLILEDIQDTVEKSQDLMGQMDIREAPLVLQTNAQVMSLVEKLGGRLRVYKGRDMDGECDCKEAEAYLKSKFKLLRDLRKLAKLKDYHAHQLAAATGDAYVQPGVVKLLVAPFREAEIEFDFVHRDGFVEDSIKVFFDRRIVRFIGVASESALDHFWGTFADVVR